MKNPSLWNKTDLHLHLQHALELELWTIPLYLTALYSIKDLKKLKPREYPDAAKLVFSVVIQEMLHLELVCNISNALGYSPRFSSPVYDQQKGIPFIHPSKNNLPEFLKGYSVKPQALNENSLKLFCAIELPYPQKEIVWDKEKSVHSIAELYEALKLGILALWDECYVGDKNNTKQKSVFNEYHNEEGKSHGFSQTVHSPATALKAIEAIIEQGEGADSKKVPSDFRPPIPAEGKEYDASWFKGHLSHYQKFRLLIHSHHKLPPVYMEIPGKNNIAAELALHEAFTDFLKEMENGFNSDGLVMEISFWKKMYALSASITELWEAGICPSF